MDKHDSTKSGLSARAGSLQTTFASERQTEDLIQALDLELLGKVAGGVCSCPKCCCGTHTPVRVAM
jgi:hypothetical protein